MNREIDDQEGLQVAGSNAPEFESSGKEHVPALSPVPVYYDHGSYQQPSQHYPPESVAFQKHDTVLGMGRRTFWLVFALVGLIIVGAAVGGGVGGALAVKNNSALTQTTTANSGITAGASTSSLSTNQNATPSPTTTSTSPSTVTVTVSSTSPPNITCTNGSNYTSHFIDGKDGAVPAGAKLQFTIHCNTDTAQSQNVVQTSTSTLQECIDICGSYNFWSGTGLCTGVTWEHDGPCWIKNSTLEPFKTNGRTDTAAVIS